MAETKSGKISAQKAGYEHRDFSSRGVWVFGIMLVAFLVAAVVGMAWLYGSWQNAWERREAKLSVMGPAGERAVPLPRLQVDPARELQEMRETENRVLTSYGWIDRQKGIVRIPVDRAIELLAERGVPEGRAPSGAGDEGDGHSE